MSLTGVINDRYEIERELGRGGMATVYLARDTRHGGRVALKVLSADLASMVSGERFNREIRITAGLQHPHILPVFDSGQINGLPYYVMPFVDGPTVEQRIRTEGPFPIAEALEIALEAADALAHAHAQGIVHRDIKPSNILLAHGHAVVADFGIARAVEPVTAEDDLTKTGIAIGTAAYMSPEQSAGEDVDGRADVYSLGCVLYEMLAGHPPFSAASPRALMAKHWMNEVPSLSALRKSVRRSIEALVLKALAKRPDERFASAAEFETAIQRVATEEKLVAAGFTPTDDVPTFKPPEPFTAPSPVPITLMAPAVTPTSNTAIGDEAISSAAESRVSAESAAANSARKRSLGRNLVFGVLTASVLGFATWKLMKPAEAALDRNRVMVYPLVAPTDFKGSRNIGEDIGTMIGTALDGAGDLRWIDGWPLLTPQVRQDIRNLTALDARGLARARKAAWYMTGRIIVRGDSSEVFLELNDVAGDSTVARGRAVGLTSDAWRTGLHAVNTILPSLLPAGTRNVDIIAEWNDRDPAAVASFLLAEGAFRRAHLVDALDKYRDALRTDSTFGLAAIRGAQAATWNHRFDEADSFIGLALRQRLPARYMHFARGYKAYLTGAADSSAREFRRVLETDPEMAAAWMQLGEVYMHLLPVEGNPDSLARAAFDEAYRLDPGAKELLFHWIELRLRAGEAETATPVFREFLAAEPDSTLSKQVSLMYDCITEGARGVKWAGAAKTLPLSTLSAANSLKGAGGHIDCAKSGYEAVVRADTAVAGAGRRWAAIVGLANVYLAQNRPMEAKAQIDSAIARGTGGGSYFLMAAPVFPALQSAAEAIAVQDSTAYGKDYASCPYPVRLWQLGVWEALRGRAEVADAIARNLDGQAESGGPRPNASLARSVRAFAALARGDTARATTMLRAIVSEPAPGSELAWDLAAPRGIERLFLSRLLLAAKNYSAALNVANVFDAAWPSVYLLYLPGSLEVRAQAAAAGPNANLAEQYRNRLAALRGERVVARK